MNQPIIGITSSRIPQRYVRAQFGVTEAYVQAVARAGGLPMILPLGLPEAALLQILSHLDGLLLSGGGDMHPHAYGSKPHPKVRGIDEDRDRIEIFLLRQARVMDLPVLGICRGLQVINVALGGTLYEDIQEQRPGAIQHQYFGLRPRDHRAHPVEVSPGSLLYDLLGQASPEVNSLHHQGIRNLAEGLTATAFAPDGLVEGFEVPGSSFTLAVQWHPEWLPEDPAMQALFARFVAAGQSLSAGRSLSASTGPR
jgi:putative glutamine amidotransferase